MIQAIHHITLKYSRKLSIGYELASIDMSNGKE